MGPQSAVASEAIMSCKGIRKRVKKSESEALQRYGVDNFNLLELDEGLNVMARDIYGISEDVPLLEAYGSFVMDMFSPHSDLDISINLSNKASELSRDKKLEVLSRFATKLRFLEGQGHVMNVEPVFSARVPIVKFSDRGTRVECDLSVENRDGILKSQLIHIISQIDDRFQKLCMLMKSWAKAQDINSSRDQTLSSLAITSLVAFHLQTREPPILPSFSVLFTDGTDPPSVIKRTQRFLNRARRNEETLGRLFVTLLIKLQSVERLWDKGLCIRVLNGLWITKKRKIGVGSINIEDFTDKSQNVSRAVRGEGFKKIYSSIHKSVECLVEFFDGKTDGLRLKHSLFGAGKILEPPPLPHEVHPQPRESRNEFHDHPQYHAKRMFRGNGDEIHDHLQHRAKRMRHENRNESHEHLQHHECRNESHDFPQHHVKRMRHENRNESHDHPQHHECRNEPHGRPQYHAERMRHENRNEFHDHAQRYTDGYRGVAEGNLINWREMERYNDFSATRIRYEESYLAPDTAHPHIPRFMPRNYLDDPYSRVPFHGCESSGPWVTRHAPFRVEERHTSFSFPPVGPREDYVRRFDAPPYPEPSYDRYHRENCPQPYIGRS